MTDDMIQLISLFKGNKNEANEFLRKFGDSVSDAVVFLKKFENIKLAEEHLIRINKECNEKRIILVEITANGFLMRKQKRCSSEEVGK